MTTEFICVFKRNSRCIFKGSLCDRAGIVYDTKTGTYPHDKAYITLVVNSHTGAPTVIFASPQPDPVTDTNPSNGCVSRDNDLTVTVKYTYGFLVIPSSISGPINFNAVTKMKME